MKMIKFFAARLIVTIFLIAPVSVSAQAAKDIIKASENTGLVGVHRNLKPAEIFTNKLELGLPFYVQDLEIGAAGKIDSDIYTSNGYFSSKELTIPIGTQVFAVTFKYTISGATGGYAVGNGTHEIIKWCGEIEKPSKRLNGGKYFCIPYKYNNDQKTGLDKAMFEIPPYIEPIVARGNDDPISVLFPNMLGVGANILSNYNVIVTDYKYDTELKLIKYVEAVEKKGFIISEANLDGDKKIINNQIFLPFDEGETAKINIDSLSYRIEKISTTEYKVVKIE